MKKVFFALILIIAFNSGLFCQNRADGNAEKKVTFQLSPIPLAVSLLADMIVSDDNINSFVYMMDLENQIKLSNSFNLSFTLGFFIDDMRKNDSMYEINFSPMLIYRPARTGIKGFYLSIFPTVGWYYEKNKTAADVQSILIGFGFNTGYKWVFDNGFTMQLGPGIGRLWSVQDISGNNNFLLRYLHFHLIDFKLGYSF